VALYFGHPRWDGPWRSAGRAAWSPANELRARNGKPSDWAAYRDRHGAHHALAKAVAPRPGVESTRASLPFGGGRSATPQVTCFAPGEVPDENSEGGRSPQLVSLFNQWIERALTPDQDWARPNRRGKFFILHQEAIRDNGDRQPVDRPGSALSGARLGLCPLRRPAQGDLRCCRLAGSPGHSKWPNHPLNRHLRGRSRPGRAVSRRPESAIAGFWLRLMPSWA
jgi:hypothetical protein